MSVDRLDKAAEYRRQAREARAMAEWIRLNEAKHQYLELARHLEARAEIEEQAAQETVPPEA